MHFSREEIETACGLHELGLPWVPRAGHYVYDPTGACPKPSPFQEGVYFILNCEYFMNLLGGVDRFQSAMRWLPTWHDARQLLRGLGVADESVAAWLKECQAIENGGELLLLYRLIAHSLQGSRLARVRQRLASSSPMNSSLTGSHLSGRLSQ